MEIENFYDYIKKKDDALRHYPNESKLNIKLPFRMLDLGMTGSGKTNIMLFLIKNIGIFDKVILLAKNLEEPLYEYLIEVYRKLERKHKVQMLLAISNIKDLPAVNDCNPAENTLFICDDFICDKKKDLERVEEFFIRGRKNGVSMAFLSQNYFATPKMIRQNVSYIIIKKLGSVKDCRRILAEYTLGITVSQLQQMYAYAVSSGKMTDFFMIDLETNDPRLRFRKNFAPLQ